jgi:hypothetical protein
MKCPKCKGDYIALHVVVKDTEPEVMCWKCAGEEMIFNSGKWIGPI